MDRVLELVLIEEGLEIMKDLGNTNVVAAEVPGAAGWGVRTLVNWISEQA